MNRMRMACVCGLAVMFCLVARAMADAPPEGFEALFDGKDLSNFKSVHLNSDLDTIVWKIGYDCLEEWRRHVPGFSL